ncbi:hypothetical protein DRO61_10780 [Candidatus Bathyarchaeota archaeon]|nr:MAG: hypothetical protein DRO61_10780 [Candidatus Bathyarchaeota archaeon]
MSNKSESIARWRRKTKQRIVDAFGGQCCICGYNKYNGSLSLHHIDPSTKDARVSKFMANPCSWERIVTEARKCILVCNNCHSELHGGVIDIPKKIKLFNEEYSEYKEETKQTPCVVCGKLKPERNLTCSRICSSKRTGKVDWDSIDLIKELKTKSFAEIADKLNISDMAVRKRYKKLTLE